MRRNKDFYHILLAYALVEIRAWETQEELDHVCKIADMMHNIPEALCLPWTEERDTEIYEDMHERAHMHGLEEKLNRWERGALKRSTQDLAIPVTPATEPHPAQST